MRLGGGDLLLIYVLGLVVAGIPSYVVGERRGVRTPAVAFVPLVGPYIVILWSIRKSGWYALLSLVLFVPFGALVVFVFLVPLAFVVPAEHRRTRWWGVGFLVPVAQFCCFYAYAFTLERATPVGPAPDPDPAV